MLSTLFVWLLRLPFIKKPLWRSWYQYLARHHRGKEWTFMNYGFEGAAENLALQPADEFDRCCIQLYHHVVAAADVTNRRVLEVGCGRGGGSSFIKRYLNPASVTGVDLSAEAVAFCRKTHQVEGLDFRTGDAENLPFDNAVFDFVVNVESSHCYPSLPAFLREVRRVLKPGGLFLYADLHEAGDQPRRMLELEGFEVLRHENITSQVLAALDQDDDRKRQLIDKLVPGFLLASFRDFAALRGSKIYNSFQAGALIYECFTARRPGADISI